MVRGRFGVNRIAANTNLHNSTLNQTDIYTLPTNSRIYALFGSGGSII